MQKYPAGVFTLISVVILLLNRTMGWSRTGHFVLMILLGMSIFGFLMSLFPQRQEAEEGD